MLIVILHNIRSALNVGSVFRTADACGVSTIYLTGYTPAPVDRFGRPQPMIAKTALGAEKTVPWECHADCIGLLNRLKEEKIHIAAVEQSPRAIDYKQLPTDVPLALIFGNEVGGVEDAVLSLADTIAEIPMRGKKESLNVSVSAGIVLARVANL